MRSQLSLLVSLVAVLSPAVCPASPVPSAQPVPRVGEGVSAWKVDRLPTHLPVPGSDVSRLRVPAVVRDAAVLDDGAFRPSPSPSTDGSPVEQVIVTSAALEASFQALADRETHRGVPTVVRTVEWIRSRYHGVDDPARIRTFLRDAYDYWGTRSAVLGGDEELVPTRYVVWDDAEIPADMYYACLDGEWNDDGDAIFAEPVTAAAFDGFVNSVATAPDGRAWVATHFGVAVLDGPVFQSWNAEDGLPGSAFYSIDVAADGSVWAAGENGVARWDGTAWQAFTAANGYPGTAALSIEAVSFTEAWIGTSSGLLHYLSGAWEAWGAAEGLPNVTVSDVALDGSAVWVATASGAARLESGAFTVYNTSNSGILSNWVIAVEVDDPGRVWFGHANNYFARGGLSRFDGVGWVTDDLPAWSGMSVRSFSIEPGGDEFWAATSGGLLHRTPGGDELLGAGDGLAATDCYSTSFHAGGVAVATAAGLSTGAPGAWASFASEAGLPIAPGDYDDIDLMPELELGRIPAETPAEVDIYAQKVADYEDGTLADHAETTLLLGENMFVPGDGKEVCEALKAIFPGSFTHTELYEVDGTENVAAVRSALDTAPAWIIDVGHGSYDAMGVGPGQNLLFNGDIRGSDAGGHAAMVVVYACNAGAFDLESSSEAFLFHPAGGAIGVLANTREAMATTDAVLNGQVFTDLFASGHGRVARSIRDVWLERAATDTNTLRTQTWLRHAFLSRTFQGLPSLALWRTAPRVLTVAHPAAAPLSRAPFAVHVTDALTAAPLEGALVCVSKGAEDYAYAVTDAAGDVTFAFRPESAGDIDVVVTLPDYARYDGIATVGASTGPAPVADGWQPSPARQGANGTQVDLMLAVRNVGLASTAGWTLQLVSDNPEVTVLGDTGSLPALASGESAWAGPFTVSLDPALVDGEQITVRLDGAGEVGFQELYAITIEAAGLSLDSLEVAGNDILPVVTNDGSAGTGAVTATLRALDGLGAVVDSLGGIADVAPGATAAFTDGFTVTGDPDARFELTIVDAAGRTLVRTIDRTVPEAVTGVASEPRDGAARLTWIPSASPDVTGYVVESSPAPGVWVDVFGGPVTQGSLAEVPLTPGTSGDFRIRAVDAGGNRSAGVDVTAHAAPAALPGWPRRLPSRIGPSPVTLTDLDGDDSPEIMLGSMWETNSVHVFRADGAEWADGDDDPATTGVFGVTGERVHSSALAVDVDGDGAKEIFATSYDGWLYGWRTDGAGVPAALPGWPIWQTQMGLRTTPVAADLDGDEDLEIVTVAIDGKVRAYHADGTEAAGWPFTTGGLTTGSRPVVRDLDQDGRDDLVFGATDSLLYVVSGDGTNFPGWPRPVGAKIMSAPVLVDLDGDGDFEVVCQARDGSVAAFHLDDTDGTPGADPVAGFPVLLAPFLYTPPSPAIADFDGDLVPEIVIGGGTELAVVRADGTLYPGFPIDLGADVVNSPVVADLDGDGSLDILIGTLNLREWAISIDGSVVPGWPRVFREVPWSTPAVMDVDGDGDLDVALGSNDMYLHVVDTAGPAVPSAMPWPGYHGGAQAGVYRPAPHSTGAPGPWVEPSHAAPLSLSAPAPNPFRGATTLRFATPSAGAVWLEIYDVTGRRVAEPVSGDVLPAGAHAIEWDGRDGGGRAVATGVYFLRLRTGDETRSGRVIRIR